jgi:hypothetical protein
MRPKVTQEDTSRARGTRIVRSERANRKRAEAVGAEEASGGRGTASVADCPVTLAATVRRRRWDSNASSAVSVDTLRPNALNNRKPRALSMRESVVKNT